MTLLINPTNKWLLISTLFITGASILVIELVGTRALAPFFGSGVYTWSALIAITLAALSVGYFIGGRLSDKYPHAANIFLLCLGAGIWTLLTPWFSELLLPFLAINTSTRTGVLLASLILFFPNLMMLGAIAPFVIRILTKSQDAVGSISGLVFAVSTLGSLFGALGAGFYLIPSFGMRSVYTYSGLVLLMLAAMGFLKILMDKKIFAVSGLLVLATTIQFTTTQDVISTIKIIEQKPSFYGQLQVVRKDNIKMLLVDGIAQNSFVDNLPHSTPYISFMSALPNINQSDNAANKALVIGMGAGELPMLMKQNEIYTDIVEINPTVTTLAKAHFDFDFNDQRIYYLDGRVFLLKNQQRYDYIFMDTFNAEQVAWHLLSKEALTLTKEKMTNNGLLSIHLASIISSEDVASVQKTLNAVFPYVRSFSPNVADELTSIVYLASLTPIHLSSDTSLMQPIQALYVRLFLEGELEQLTNGIVYTDDYNPMTYQRNRVHRVWRKKMREFFEDDQLEWLLL